MKRLLVRSICVVVLLAVVVPAAHGEISALTHPTSGRSPGSGHLRRSATETPSGSTHKPPSATVTAGADDPSGVAMPTVAPSGWSTVFSDDFTGTSVPADKGWWTYSDAPGGDTDGGWDPSHLVMSNGELKIEGYKDATDTSAPAGAYVTGGLKTRFSQTYGKYEVRFRMNQGQGISFAILLWPADGGWPPEIDFAEDNGASPRTLNTATLHYGAKNSTIVETLKVDMTQWHTLGVEWLPGHLTYTIDGKAWATVSSSDVPDVPMYLALQTEAWGCGDNSWKQCPNSTTPKEVDMDVDWVVAYKPAS